ncbi:hypothetical protein GCM10010873_22050 [Cypionkella aquatica]|uniref:Lysozyme inhibitor LprI-like N-terminal domain-containing protein n=2 Tax=Cypionkella aquatica TaxID=1756042 RepID=A0AA37X445_9RHOB|nr:hypothetical protein GCM10010873_22050 [Cypionkella aquatica]
MGFYRAAYVISLMAWPATAQDVDCGTAESQMELTYCAEQDWMAADAELNTAYAAARKQMQGIDDDLEASQRGAAEYLRDGQRAWVTFRDATCAAEGYAMHGGSAEPMVIYGCRARLTEQRVADLKAMAEEY